MATVHVSNISSQTSEKEVRDFFSFCGKITSLSISPSSGDAGAPQSATVTFEKETAAKTALLLDQTQLGPSSVHVTSAANIEDLAGDKAATAPEAKDEQEHGLEQEDKPRSRIFAEYLAQGYAISDQAIQKAIALDHQRGFSQRFTSALSDFDKKYHATDKAKGIDESYKISDKATTGWRSLNSYFEMAMDTPTGRKVRDFYIQTEKQVQDIHNEARRLADLKNAKTATEQGQTSTEKESSAPVAPSGAPAGDPTGSEKTA